MPVVYAASSGYSLHKSVRGNRASCWLACASLAAIIAGLASPSLAASQNAPIEEVVVSGSRVISDGYNAPTPVTVLGEDAINQIAPLNIADAVNQLPQLAGSATPGNPANSVSSGNAGVNFLNLRDLGTARTLVLLDGHRVAPSTATGVVDINTLPSGLVKRVDVVTGGASAAYGSDAVAGVVNFVLDTDFTGLKGSISAGAADNGVDLQEKLSLSYGVPFADDRGHVLFNVTASGSQGARYADEGWYNPTKEIVKNPAYAVGNGQYKYIYTDQANYVVNTPGGLITSGPAKGVMFGPGGSPSQFVYGASTGGNEYVGGTYNPHDPDPTLYAPIVNQTAFGRVSYDFSSSVTAFAQFAYGHAKVNEDQGGIFTNGGNITIKADNAYIPDSVKTATEGQSFSFNSSHADFGRWGAQTDRSLLTGLVGVKGTIGGGWSWDASYQYGQNDIDLTGLNMYNKANYALAADAVVNPANGAIVCRSSLANPGNGCAPLDVFGTGVASPAALSYIMGDSHSHIFTTQQIGSANLRGEPFSTWAGPVSVAVGVEGRAERISSTVDAVSAVSGWYTGNYQPTNGSNNVVEGYMETLVPLARNLPFAHSLDFNGAVRETSYKFSGLVTTWKAGIVYAPWSDEFRIRANHSRDIRAPDLSDLFGGGTVTAGNTYTDPRTGTKYNVQTISGIGNTSLTPELADTDELGIVYSPSWLDGLSLSVDYFSISVSDAIASLTGQDIVDNCNHGDQNACTLVSRDPVTGLLSQVRTGPLNFDNEKERGFDVEASYVAPLDRFASGLPGVVSLRILAANVQEHSLTDGDVVTNYAGAPLYDPHWKMFGTIGYDIDPVSFAVSVRYTSGGPIGSSASSYTADALQDNTLPSEAYVDLYGSYAFQAADQDFEAYVKVRNLFNVDPPITTTLPYSTDPGTYDVLGRVITVGLRFH
jgi:outer membrane receptor protein involved in Fe transport